MFRTALVVAATLVAAPAFAQPSVTDDLDVSVDSVAPSSSGMCEMKGWVVTVRQSERFEPGSAIDLSVPCSAAGGAEGYYFEEMATTGRNKTISLRLSGDRVVAWRTIDAG